MTRSLPHGLRPPSTNLTRRLLTPLAVALGVTLALGLFDGGVPAQQGDSPKAKTQPPAQPALKPALLTSRPAPQPPELTGLDIGEEVKTTAGQRRLLVLPGGATLYVNENTQVKLEAAGQLVLATGEVYVAQPPTGAKKAGAISVQVPGRKVTGPASSSFAVRAEDKGARVLVTRGQVQVSGLEQGVSAGQRLLPGDKNATVAPRPAHLLGWAQELMTAAATPLVPDSAYTGGALVCIDPNGQETKLTLRKYHIDVVIEDGFARTTIDQTYFNHESFQTEGTFFFPLPADGSLSRLAMYVDGKLMEGGMVERNYGAEVYDTIKYMKKDPALLEWVDGSTFKMRVFPIEPRKEKRLLLSYTQKLPALYGESTYRFPAGHSLPAVKEWSLAMRLKGGAGVQWASPSHTLNAKKDKGDLLLSASAKNALFQKDVVVQTDDPALTDESAQKVKFAVAVHEDHKYLMVKLRPDLFRPEEAPAKTESRNWLFLFESSGDRDPLLGRVQIEVIRHLLMQANPGDTFNVLAANTKTRSFAEKPQPVNADTIAEAIAFLEGSHLIGALDLGHAFTRCAEQIGKEPNTFLVHTGTGIAAMGEKRADVLATMLPGGVRYIGVGVGKRWNRGFMKSTAENTGGYVTQINPDEPLAWRAFELASTLQTLGPVGLRKAEISIPGGDGKAPRFLYFNELLTAGEELCAVTRLEEDVAWPKGITLTFADGKDIALPLAKEKADAGYLPRMWAKLEIDRLLAEAPFEKKHKDEVIALSKAMYVMSPFTSLLVLENEDMYKQYKVDKGRKDHWALYPAPEKIDVVYEPEDGTPAQKKGAKTPQQVLQTICGMKQAGSNAFKDVLARVDQTYTGSLMLGVGVNSDAGLVGNLTLPTAYKTQTKALEMGQPFPYVKSSTITIGDGPIEAAYSQFAPVAVTKQLNWALPQNGFVAGLTPAGTFTPYLNIPIKGNSFDYTQSPAGLGGFPGQLGSIKYAGAPAPKAPLALDELIVQSEDLRQISNELRHFWMNDQPSHMTYERISGGIGPDGSSDNAAVFSNLLAYAPGMNTSASDIAAVLEAEAEFPRPVKHGKIDAAVKPLFAKARGLGWHKLVLDGKKGSPQGVIVFDGQGRFASTLALPPGLAEQVVCDGKTLMHIYPQLGLAAQRSVSRFHRAGTSSMLPWVVPPVEDLAHGADLKLVAARTVDVIPHGSVKKVKDKEGKEKEKTSYRLRLIFREDGGLAERQIVQMPEDKIMLRQVCNANGLVRVLDEKGKEVATVQGKLTPLDDAPKLTADTKGLVVLDLPYRTPEFVAEKLKIKGKGDADLTFAEATAMFAAALFTDHTGAQARNIFVGALRNRNEKQLGYYVLLAAAGFDLGGNDQNVVEDHPDAPLAQYLALHTSPTLRQHASQWAVGSVQWQDPLLRHLATTHALFQRWQSKQVAQWPADRLAKERTQALQYVKNNAGTGFGWAMLSLLQDKAGKDKAFLAQLAQHWPLFATQGLSYAPRYEEARCLFLAGQEEPCRTKFQKLYADALAEGILPPIDSTFRQALLTAPGLAAWGELMEGTARKLIEDKKRPAVLALAWQCWQLDDGPQADRLLHLALTGIKDGKERSALQLAGVLFYQKTKQLPQADQLLAKLLADPKQGHKPALWRLAAEIASQRKLPAQSMACLEKALDLEFKDLPAVLNLTQVRQDYGKLLDHYQGLADAIVALKVEPPEGFVGKVIQTADRWRSLDPKSSVACDTAARILVALGQKDMGWDYLTTPIALQPAESGPWAHLADSLRQGGEVTLADLAYKAACEADPNSAQLLWDRAENLEQSGKTVGAQALYRQIAEGHWGPQYAGLVAQAKLRLR